MDLFRPPNTDRKRRVAIDIDIMNCLNCSPLEAHLLPAPCGRKPPLFSAVSSRLSRACLGQSIGFTFAMFWSSKKGVLRTAQDLPPVDIPDVLPARHRAVAPGHRLKPASEVACGRNAEVQISGRFRSDRAVSAFKWALRMGRPSRI